MFCDLHPESIFPKAVAFVDDVTVMMTTLGEKNQATPKCVCLLMKTSLGLCSMLRVRQAQVMAFKN